MKNPVIAAPRQGTVHFDKEVTIFRNDALDRHGRTVA
jgi:hypothetical protein